MGIPTAPRADHIAAAHTLVAHDQILGDARLDMVDARAAIGGRRPLEEDKWIGLVAACKRLLDNAVLLPPLIDRLFQRWKRQLRIDFFKRHSSSPDCRLQIIFIYNLQSAIYNL